MDLELYSNVKSMLKDQMIKFVNLKS